MPRLDRAQRLKLPVLALSLLLSGSGCNTRLEATPKNFQQALNTYFSSHNECLFEDAVRFPFEVAPGANAKLQARRMDALTASGLLQREQSKALQVSRYTLTPAGERAAPRFCYGHRQVSAIDSFTPPAKQNGFLETSVTYRYTMLNLPVWADTPQMREAFPDMAAAASGNASATTTLAQTGVGWQVPG